MQTFILPGVHRLYDVLVLEAWSSNFMPNRQVASAYVVYVDW